MMTKLRYLDEFIVEQGLSKKDVCIVGSFAMEVAGHREAGDIDIVLKMALRKKLGFDFNSATKVNEVVEVVRPGWAEFAGITDNQLVEDPQFSDLHNGYRVATLDLLCQKKKKYCREKDYPDLKLLGVPVYTRLQLLFKRQFLKILSRIKRYVKQSSFTVAFVRFRRSKSLLFMVEGRYELAVTPSNLLSAEYVNGGFSRYDAIVRLLAVEAFHGENDYGFELYNKMQAAREAPEGYEQRFRVLIQSVRDQGFDWKSVIEMKQDAYLCDGSHRLALAFYHQVPLLSVRVNWGRRGAVIYGLDWFSKHGFTGEQCALIEARKQSLFWSEGLYFSIILWPPVADLFDQIQEELEHHIVQSDDFQYSDVDFEAMVRAVYVMDDIADWKVDKKLEHMAPYENKIRVLWLEFPDPEYRKKAMNNADISQVGERLKRKIRDQYRGGVSNYIYDIICHTSDNSVHNQKMMQIFMSDQSSIQYDS